MFPGWIGRVLATASDGPGQKKGASDSDAPGRWLKVVKFQLELEAHGPLNLPFAEERAARRVHLLKRGNPRR